MNGMLAATNKHAITKQRSAIDHDIGSRRRGKRPTLGSGGVGCVREAGGIIAIAQDYSGFERIFAACIA